MTEALCFSKDITKVVDNGPKSQATMDNAAVDNNCNIIVGVVTGITTDHYLQPSTEQTVSGRNVRDWLTIIMAPLEAITNHDITVVS